MSEEQVSFERRAELLSKTKAGEAALATFGNEMHDAQGRFTFKEAVQALHDAATHPDINIEDTNKAIDFLAKNSKAKDIKDAAKDIGVSWRLTANAERATHGIKQLMAATHEIKNWPGSLQEQIIREKTDVVREKRIKMPMSTALPLAKRVIAAAKAQGTPAASGYTGSNLVAGIVDDMRSAVLEPPNTPRAGDGPVTSLAKKVIRESRDGGSTHSLKAIRDAHDHLTNEFAKAKSEETTAKIYRHGDSAIAAATRRKGDALDDVVDAQKVLKIHEDKNKAVEAAKPKLSDANLAASEANHLTSVARRASKANLQEAHEAAAESHGIAAKLFDGVAKHALDDRDGLPLSHPNFDIPGKPPGNGLREAQQTKNYAEANASKHNDAVEWHRKEALAATPPTTLVPSLTDKLRMLGHDDATIARVEQSRKNDEVRRAHDLAETGIAARAKTRGGNDVYPVGEHEAKNAADILRKHAFNSLDISDADRAKYNVARKKLEDHVQDTREKIHKARMFASAIGESYFKGDKDATKHRAVLAAAAHDFANHGIEDRNKAHYVADYKDLHAKADAYITQQKASGAKFSEEDEECDAPASEDKPTAARINDLLSRTSLGSTVKKKKQ